MKKIEIDMLNPFGAPVLHGSLPEEMIDSFDKICQDVLDKQITPWNTKLVGRISDEWKVPDLLYKDYKVDILLDSLFKKYVETYYTHLRKIFNLQARKSDKHIYDEELKLEVYRGDGWVNSMKSGEFNPMHHHSNCDLSSIFYINDYQGDEPRIVEKGPDNSGKNNGGVTEFLIGSYSNGVVPSRTQDGRRHYSQGFPMISHFSVKPKRGDFLIFPHWLMHTVYPFIGKDRRLSFSINYHYQVDLTKDKILSSQMQ